MSATMSLSVLGIESGTCVCASFLYSCENLLSKKLISSYSQVTFNKETRLDHEISDLDGDISLKLSIRHCIS